MARPQKNNCDYFSHDTDMRDDPKIKAVRAKFGLEGYAIWCMLLEYIGDCDFFEIKVDELTYEIIAGDFKCDAEKLKSVIEYCLKLNLLQLVGDYIRCNQFSERMRFLTDKREFRRNKQAENTISVDQNTQRKEKESKENKIKERERGLPPLPEKFKSIEGFKEQWNIRLEILEVKKPSNLNIPCIEQDYRKLLETPDPLKALKFTNEKKAINILWPDENNNGKQQTKPIKRSYEEELK